ncbi:PASTA domain-containing protein [Nocardia sp. NPDC058705]|uniref:PASTA domain-containing protein n=1 Tax=Nocardia sp. NPDC058705 TaxID=3346609 RepID=UPI0036C3AAB6
MIRSLFVRLQTVAGVLPTWKFILAVGFFCFALFCVVVLPFSDIGFPAAVTYSGLALVPVLYLAGVERKHNRRAAGGFAKLGFNWIPVGIVVSVVLIFGGAALSESSKPGRDPSAAMPQLVGMTLADAKDALKGLELEARTHDDTADDRQVLVASNWTVTSQHPPAGTVLGDLAEVGLGVVKHGEMAESAAPSEGPAPVSSSTAAPDPTSTDRREPEPHNACLLIDPGALGSARMSPTLQAPLHSAATSDSEAIFACANDLGEVTLEVTAHASDSAARTAADYATRSEILTSPFTPFPNALRVPFDPDTAGAKVIATQTGVSRISWSLGSYSLLLEINSDPVVQGLTPRHPVATLDRLIDDIVDRSRVVIANGSW